MAIQVQAEAQAQLRATWGEAALHLLLILPDPPFPAGAEGLSLFLDPAGDGRAYYEIGLRADGVSFCRAARRTRGGTITDPRWRCDGLAASVAPAAPPGKGWSASLSIPFTSLGSLPPGPGWRVAIEKSAPVFRPPRCWSALRF